MARLEDESGELMRAMEAYQQGHVEAFDRLYQKLAPRLQSFLISKSLNAGTAEDLLQETFLQIHRSRHTYQKGRPVVPWAFGIARNVWLMHRRECRRRREEALEEEVLLKLEVPAGLANVTDRVTAGRALAGLSSDQREALLLHYLWGFTFREIGGILGVRPVTAKLRAFRARRALQERILAVTEVKAEAK